MLVLLVALGRWLNREARTISARHDRLHHSVGTSNIRSYSVLFEAKAHPKKCGYFYLLPPGLTIAKQLVSL